MSVALRCTSSVAALRGRPTFSWCRLYAPSPPCASYDVTLSGACDAAARRGQARQVEVGKRRCGERRRRMLASVCHTHLSGVVGDACQVSDALLHLEQQLRRRPARPCAVGLLHPPHPALVAPLLVAPAFRGGDQSLTLARTQKVVHLDHQRPPTQHCASVAAPRPRMVRRQRARDAEVVAAQAGPRLARGQSEVKRHAVFGRIQAQPVSDPKIAGPTVPRPRRAVRSLGAKERAGHARKAEQTCFKGPSPVKARTLPATLTP